MKIKLNTITIFLLTIIVLNCKLQKKNEIPSENHFDKDEISLEEDFDKAYENYEFLIKNPIFYYPNAFFSNLEFYKNKYFLKIDEEYEIDENGEKTYGDGDIWYIGNNYYSFDEEGRIKDEYFINCNSIGDIVALTHTKYIYEKEKLIKQIIDVLEGEESKEEFNIKEEETKLILKQTNEDGGIFQIIIEKGIITTKKWNNEELVEKTVFILQDDTVIEKEFIIDSDGKEILQSEQRFKKGSIVEANRFNSFVNSNEQFLLNEEGIGEFRYQEIRDNDVLSFSHYFERRYNEIGFLEYEMEGPSKNGESGRYVIKKAKLFDEPDELLIKYFGDVIEKE